MFQVAPLVTLTPQLLPKRRSSWFGGRCPEPRDKDSCLPCTPRIVVDPMVSWLVPGWYMPLFWTQDDANTMVFGFIRTLSNLSKLYLGSWNIYFQSDVMIFSQWSEGFLVTLVHFIGELGASPLVLHCFTMGLRNSCHKGLPKGHSTTSLNHQLVSTERRSSGPQQIHTRKISALASIWIQLQNLDICDCHLQHKKGPSVEVDYIREMR